MLHELNPFIRHARRQTFYDREPYDRRAVDYRLFFGFTHKVQIAIENRKYTLEPDTVIIIAPNITYNIFAASSSKAKFAVVDFEMTAKNKEYAKGIAPYVGDTAPVELLPPDLIAPFEHIFVLENAKFAKKNLLSIISNFVLCEPLYREFSSVLLKEILLNCCRMQSDCRMHLSPLVARTVDFVRLHLAYPITNAALAKTLGYSAGYINECFKKELGTTLHAYILDARLKQACFLLKTEDSTIADIASRCGFQSPAYFSAMFRRAYGQTPQSFRVEAENP